MELNRAVPIQRPTHYRRFLVAAKRSSNDAARQDVKIDWSNPVKTTLDRWVKPDSGYEMVLFPFFRKVPQLSSSDPVASDLAEARSMELRRLASEQLTNIDIPERTRRKILGAVLLALTVGVDVVLVMEKAGFWNRLAVTPLLLFGMAYLASGQVGLCNIAQSGLWQVDGKGLTTIEDQNLAERIRQRVNRFNVVTTITGLTISLVFASIPL